VKEEKKRAIDNLTYREDKEKMQKDNGIKVAGLPGIPKGLTVDDAIETFKMSLDRDPKNLKEVIDFFKNRKLNKKTPEISKTIA
tara:strand:+ start:351 stop:602 length:252 start_codon:yes stop_codon:yes gene_type:complete